MKWWILLAVAALLLFWMISRERFEPTPLIKAPPYDDAEKLRMFNMLSSGDKTAFLNRVRTDNPQLPTDSEELKLMIRNMLSNAAQRFYEEVYRPATTPIVNPQIDNYVPQGVNPGDREIIREFLRTYFIGQANRAAYTSTGGPGAEIYTGATDDRVDPVCPAGTSLYTAGYGLPKCLAPGVTDFTCPAGYIPTASRDCRSMTTPADTRPPQCPTGTEFNNERGGCISPLVDPTCPANYHLVAGQGTKCIRIGSGSGSGIAPDPSSTPSPTGATGTTQSSTSSTNTGAQSAVASSSTQPTPTTQKSRIYGPRFTELGTPSTRTGNGNGNGNGQYPEIWGGGLGAAAEKVGATGSNASGDSITMPSLSSLGLDSNAMYFPFSRSPGDMDRIPDPYRVSQSWLPSRYSYNKTEPAPFLTDFSAFLR